MLHRIPPETLQAHLDSLLPARPPGVLEMERIGAERDFPIIGPQCGAVCYLAAKLMGARRVFELGSGFGYSAYWFASAVKENGGGEVHHTEYDEGMSRDARARLKALGLAGVMRFHVGDGMNALRRARGPFDIVFCDIEKEDYPAAVPVAAKKLRHGGVFVLDNMLWDGRIFDEKDEKASTKGIREATRLIREDPSWVVTLLPLRDGMMLAMKR